MKNLRSDFPIFKKMDEQSPLIYFDNAATTQKPQCVINALTDFYMYHNAPINRGIYTSAERATLLYEEARNTVAHCIGAKDSSEIVFTHGTTDSINCIAFGWAAENIKPGDEILITELEHHSNIVPWQQVAQKQGALLRYIPVLANGTLDMSSLQELLTTKTKLISVTHISNTFGSKTDVSALSKAAHAVGAKIFLDAAQSVGHKTVNVIDLDVDFLAFSGHKVFGPTGIGVLYVRKELHDQIPPYQYGGGMVYDVTWQTAHWHKMPQRLEAGTPPIAQAIGLAAALRYIQHSVNYAVLQEHEAALCAQLIEGLSLLPGVTVLGPQDELKRSGHIVSFMVEGIHPHDIAAYLDSYGICVRAGNHCAQPLAQRIGIYGSVRVSFCLYNTSDEVARLIKVLEVFIKEELSARGFV